MISQSSCHRPKRREAPKARRTYRKARHECCAQHFWALTLQVSNVLKLNYSMPDTLSIEVRQLIDAMLQVRASERASISELCLDRWVMKGGDIPPDTDSASIDLVCAECEEAAPVGSVPRLRWWMARNWKRVLLYVFYAALVAGLLLMTEHTDGGMSHALLAQDDRQ